MITSLVAIEVDKIVAKVGRDIILKSELGNYTTLFSEDFTVFEGNKIRLSCPICRKRLATRKSKNIAQLHVVDDENNEFTIYFSQLSFSKPE